MARSSSVRFGLTILYIAIVLESSFCTSSAQYQKDGRNVSSTSFRPLTENTIVVKLYSAFGEVAVGNYLKLHAQINLALDDLGSRYGVILYAQSGVGVASSVYLKYADNDHGPVSGSDIKSIVMIEYYCPHSADTAAALQCIHDTITKALDPTGCQLNIRYMIISSVDMDALGDHTCPNPDSPAVQ